jgi:predicted metal-dependent hydrolase
MTQSKTIEIAGVGPVLFERSRRARRIIISVDPLTGIRVAVPHRASFKRAEDVARTQTGWIQKQLDRMKVYQGQRLTSPLASEAIDRAEAKRKLTRRVKHLAHRHGFTYGRVSIRNQRTRWGSCSSRGNISLNMKLSRLPEELMDYVILHELAHTRVKDHSQEFWALMDRLVGNGKAKAAELRKYRIGCL